MKHGTLIGLTGYATAGKDEFADRLVEEFGYHKLSFADPMYEMAVILNPTVKCIDAYGMEYKALLSDVVDEYGWTKAKRFADVRSFLQRLGTEAGRKCIGEDVWVNALDPRAKKLIKSGENVVVTNVRFKNEARWVTRNGGFVVRINRPGIGPVNNHPSDGGEAFDFAICDVSNDGTKEDLRNVARHIHHSLSKGRDEDKGSPKLILAAYRETVHRAIELGAKLILDVSAPVGADLHEFTRRHNVTASDRDESGDPGVSDFEIEIDGECAGSLRYEDGVLTVDVHVSR